MGCRARNARGRIQCGEEGVASESESGLLHAGHARQSQNATVHCGHPDGEVSGIDVVASRNPRRPFVSHGAVGRRNESAYVRGDQTDAENENETNDACSYPSLSPIDTCRGHGRYQAVNESGVVDGLHPARRQTHDAYAGAYASSPSCLSSSLCP